MSSTNRETTSFSNPPNVIHQYRQIWKQASLTCSSARLSSSLITQSDYRKMRRLRNYLSCPRTSDEHASDEARDVSDDEQHVFVRRYEGATVAPF